MARKSKAPDTSIFSFSAGRYRHSIDHSGDRAAEAQRRQKEWEKKHPARSGGGNIKLDTVSDLRLKVVPDVGVSLIQAARPISILRRLIGGASRDYKLETLPMAQIVLKGLKKISHDNVALVELDGRVAYRNRFTRKDASYVLKMLSEGSTLPSGANPLVVKMDVLDADGVPVHVCIKRRTASGEAPLYIKFKKVKVKQLDKFISYLRSKIGIKHINWP